MTALHKGIIQDFINGEEVAFAKIYKHYYQQINTYCYKHTRSIELAEELTSDVFLRFWEARTYLDPEKDISPYLFTITKNVAFTWLKRITTDQKMKEIFRQRYLSDQADASQDQIIAAGIDLAILRKIMAKIPHKRRQAFELCKIDGFTYTEAASILSISKETIKEHLSLAKKDLSKMANTADYLYILLPLSLILNIFFQ